MNNQRRHRILTKLANPTSRAEAYKKQVALNQQLRRGEITKEQHKTMFDAARYNKNRAAMQRIENTASKELPKMIPGFGGQKAKDTFDTLRMASKSNPARM